MTYADTLNLWAVTRIHLNKPVVVGRYKNRSDAEGHAATLTRLTDHRYTVVFMGGETHG